MQKLSCLDFHMTVKIILLGYFPSSGSPGPGRSKTLWCGSLVSESVRRLRAACARM